MHAEIQQIYVIILHCQQNETTDTDQGNWTSIFFAQVNFLKARFPDY